MSRNLTYFASDFHLGASYIKDSHEHERKIVDWLKSIEPTCCHLYLLGDILDYWYEYKYVVPRGFIRFFGQLAVMADSGIKITWLIGNHDIWIFDYLPCELGIVVIDGSIKVDINNKKFYLSHGDAIGELKKGFRFIRSIFRNKYCQKFYSSIHPGITVPFAHRWSAGSRKGYSDEFSVYRGDDKEPYLDWCKSLLKEDVDLNYIILGHRHIVLEKKISAHCDLVILGDWIRNFSYAVFDGNELKLRKYN